MARPRFLVTLTFFAAGCSAEPPSNEGAIPNEVQIAPAPGGKPSERNETGSTPNGNGVEADPESPCPPGVEVCIPRGEVPEPVANRH